MKVQSRKTSKKTKKTSAKRVPKPKPFKISDDISKEELLAQYELLEQQKKEAVKLIDELKDQDPFWYYEPTDGNIDEEGKAFIAKYIKPDDIPQKLDGQLDVLLSKASIVGAGGANQSGKSLTGTIRGIIKSTGELPIALKPYEEHFKADIERAKGKVVRGRVVAVDFKQLNNTVIPTWRKFVPRSYLLKGSWDNSFSVQHSRLSLYRNGQKHCADVEFMTNSMDVESFQGPPLDWLSYDEEPREDIHRENLMRFTTADKLDIGFFWTPTKGLTWTYDLFMESDSDNVQLFRLCSVSNPKANREVLQKICDNIKDNYDELKMRLLGEFVSLSGLIYGNLFSNSIHVIEPFYENLQGQSKKEDYVCLYGMDPHLATPFALVFMLVDRFNNCYIDRCYFKNADTEEFKTDFHAIVKEMGYRIGWGTCDKSANTNIMAFGGLNIFTSLKRGANYLPSLRESMKFEGSIKAGVDIIKQRLKVNEVTGKPSLFVVNRPENKELIKSFKTLERDTYANEDKKGEKDRILEGRHHLHASMRYMFQYPIRHYADTIVVPEPSYYDSAVLY